ncbi:hypothetical protein McanCB21832_003743 [Microsporum canis]
MTEEEELLAKIGQLAGQINQHKNQSNPAARSGYSGASYARHPRGGWRPYRGRARGAPRPIAGPHRNRTLVLNNQSTTSETASSTASPSRPTDELNDPKLGVKSSWIAKRDRHMQLINSSIFDQETQARNKAIAETQRLKAQRKSAREESMVLRHAQSASRFPRSNKGESHSDGKTYTIHVGKVPFQVAQGGSKLISLSSDPLKANLTPKKVKVGGVMFLRSKRGNLHRLGAVASKKYTHARITPGAPVCRDFAILGYCSKGATCEERHVHECPDYANTGNCGNKKCSLPHVDRAGQIRKFTNQVDNSTEADSEEDISSDEEVYDEIDSDDIDSDDLEEPEEIIQGVDGGDASQQLDFIGFS